MEDEYLNVLKRRFVYLCEIDEEGPELDALRIILKLWDIHEVDGYEV